MEEYPEELRTPPVTLAAMVGCADLHPLISTHFLSAQPPINTLALPHLSKIYLFERKPKDSNAEVPPLPPTVVGGILKKDWLLKHRTKVPAVLGALFRAEHVFGDPAQWNNVCSDLDSIKTVIRGRNIKLAVVIIHTGAEEITEDKMIALRKRADVDAKYIVGVTTRLPAIQRLVEIKFVSEQLNFKICTLLLHSGKVTESVAWFRQHKNAYKRLVGTPEAIFLHWEWMSRQYLVFGELLETSSKTAQIFPPITLGSASKLLSEWEFHPAYYYQLAAHYLSEKRSALELVISTTETSSDTDTVDSVVPSTYVGQFARLLELGDNVDMMALTDEEYMRYAVSEGRRFRDSLEIIALLKKAYESFNSGNIQRMAALCGFQMGKEYFSEGDTDNAKQIFDSIAILYRKEGLQRDTGPAGPASLIQRETVHKEVFDLVTENSALETNEQLSNLKITEDKSLQLQVDLASPLSLVMIALVAFHEQTMKPGSLTSISVSLLSNLPHTVEIDQLEIQFNQPSCNFFVSNAQKPQSVGVTDNQQRRVETSTSLTLEPNKWLKLTYDITSDQSGKLECLSVIAKIGPHFRICCKAESPASLDNLPVWALDDCIQSVPIKDNILVLSGQKTIQVEEPEPQVDVRLGAFGPALVGEIFLVPVTVISKGHDVYSGELKINLVDVRGGGLFSPRENEPHALDSHHVQLLGISGPEGEEDSHLDSDKIKQVQQSFGLISVPFLKDGDSWSCKLEIKWHRPKPIMLYVSLGYTPNNESNSQMVHVHKNLQIEGQNAIELNHHYLMPFRRDPLILSKNKQASESDLSQSLPLNQKTLLIVSTKNCTELPIRLKSISIETEGDVERTCSNLHGNEEFSSPVLVAPGREFKKVFSMSSDNISKLVLGNLCLTWRRDFGVEEQSASTAATWPWVVTKQKLPDMDVELPPLIVNLECPPYAILGDPFTYYIRILNQTPLLQEIKYTLADAQSFVLSGYHNDTIYVLPKSEHILSYKLVPLASGLQQLPRFSMTSVRYSAAYQPSTSSNSVFVFPSKPHFKNAASTNFRVESVANE
ncbi:hypothetical protein PIB30_024814 [Stylosanthes scabra]|uniref:Trafficking protein particle complex subunit 11 domain-containing protein n=1 Tax=Stylosanthes scabra TaxID=79078 RepID=A0ABU6X842_9FABA|nr:hypothetical protein [Stylosanthes scabra]